LSGKINRTFSIFLLDETDFCNTFPWPGLLAHARDCDGRLLGHEFREHEGAFEPRVLGGADFHASIRGDVLFASRNFAQAVPLRKLEARTDFVRMRAYGLHALLLGRKHGAFDFAVEQCVAHCLHESAVDHDFWRAHLQGRATL